MTTRFLGAALALASLISPTIAAAQVADRAGAPSGTAPLQAPCVVQANGTCAAVKDTVPMPVVITSRPTGTSAGQVQGTNPNGTTDIGNPVTVAGSDGTNTRTLRTDADGRMQVEGGVASGNADSGRPVKTGGYASGGIPGTVGNGQRVNDWNALTGAKVFSPGSATLGYGLSLTASPSLVQDANGSARPLGVIGMVTDGANGVFQRDANTASGTTGTGLLGVGNLGFDGTNWRAMRTDSSGNLGTVGANGHNSGIGTFMAVGGVGSSSAPTAVTSGNGTRAWYGLNGQTIISTGSNGGVTFSNVWSSANGLGDTQNNARPLIVAPVVASSGNAAVVQLDANAASATSGTGLLGAGILGRAQSTLNPLTDNTYNAVAIDTRGNVRARLVGSNSVTPNDSGTTYTNVLPAPSATTETSGAPLAVGNFYWSGTAVVAARGDTTGAYVVPKGGPSIATSQTSVGTTAALVAPARVGRNKVTVTIGAANSCALGNAGVTLSTGFPLQPVAGASITLDTAAAIYAVCSATTTVSDIETF